MEPRANGQLQGAPNGGLRRRTPPERHRQGHEGRPPGVGGRWRGRVMAERAPGLSAFADLRVIERGVWVAAPSAAALLADWGADVIKIEPATGDPMRSAFGSLGIGGDRPNPAFSQDNRGKRSVVLDLRDPEGRAQLEELLAGADVFISNLRPD